MQIADYFGPVTIGPRFASRAGERHYAHGVLVGSAASPVSTIVIGVVALCVGLGMALDIGGLGTRYVQFASRIYSRARFDRYRRRWFFLALLGLLLAIAGIARL